MATRRDFLTTLAAALGTAILARSPRVLRAERVPPHLSRIGIQLYTLRDLMEKDLEGTLARVAAIGYQEVEFAGYFGRTPEQIKAALATNHLVSPSSHVALPADDDAWKKTLDDAKTAGHEWVVIAYLDAALRKAPDDWTRLADRFNHLGLKAKDAGLRFAYHNHDFELARVGKGTALDVLLGKTDRKLVDFEMDIYWVVKGGGDPLAFIRKYPGRFKLMHVKDASPAPERTMMDVGSGTIDFAKIFAQGGTSGMKHAFVEHDNPTNAIASATNSYKYLVSLH
ncbi:MAG: Xylose isomerase protein barrel [Gemmatimonadetes bacterium]|nr:Xylose isomerase protein barrel [Gemmatimonadota bacterium]